MLDKSPGKSKHIFLLLRAAVVIFGFALGIFWICKGQRWGRLIEIFHRINIGIFIFTLVLFIIGQILTSIRWWLLLKAQSITIGIWPAVRLNFLGWFYNNFMPGSVGGDLIRAWYVTKHTDKKVEAALSVFVDRIIIGLTGTLFIALVCYILFMRHQLDAMNFTMLGSLAGAVSKYKWILVWIVAAVGAVFAVILLYKPGRLWMKNIYSYIYVRLVKIFCKLKNSAVIYFSKPLIMLAALGMTVVLQLMSITGFWLLGGNLGIDAGLRYYYFIFTLSWVLGALPVSIGGAVVVESLLAYLFVVLTGAQAEAALALALCQRFIWMLSSLPGAVIHLTGTHLPKDFFLDYNEPSN